MFFDGISSLSFACIPILWRCPPNMSHRFYLLSAASMLNHTTYDFFVANPQYKWTKRMVELLDGAAILRLSTIYGVHPLGGVVLFYLFSKFVCDIEFIKKIFFIQYCAILSIRNPYMIAPLLTGSYGYFDYNKSQKWTFKNRLFWHVSMSIFLGCSINSV